MKATGITRPIDKLGRINIPVELRKNLNINIGDKMEIFTDDKKIVMGKYNPGCEICGSLDDVHTVLGMKFCMKHLKEIAKAVE